MESPSKTDVPIAGFEAQPYDELERDFHEVRIQLPRLVPHLESRSCKASLEIKIWKDSVLSMKRSSELFGNHMTMKNDS